MNIKDCLEKRYLTKVEIKEDLVKKESEEGSYDFDKAKKALNDGDYKWAIVKSYYSMFHSAKAVCFQLGYREKKYFAVLVVLEELNKEGKLEKEYINYFQAAIDSREGADYRYAYPKEIAEYCLKIAGLFNERMKELLEEV